MPTQAERGSSPTTEVESAPADDVKVNTVLLVDDQPSILRSLGAVLHIHGYRVLKAENGLRALELARSESPDVVITDIQMPDVDGFEVCRRLKADQATCDIPLIFLTAEYTDEQSVVRGLEMGANDYLTKPIDNAELLARVQVMLRIKAAEDRAKRINQSLSDALSRLSDERDRLQAVLNSTNEGILMLSPEGKLLTSSTTFWNLLQVSPDDWNGLPWLVELFESNPSGKSASPALPENLLSDPAISHEWSVDIGGPRQRTLRGYIGPVNSPDGVLVGRIVVLRDITREAQIDRMKTEFIAIASHEVRTPLAAISGYLELVLDGDAGEIPEQARKFLQVARRNVDRMTNLVEDMLDVSSIEAGEVELHLEPVMPVDLVEEVLAAFQASAEEKEIALTSAVDTDLPAVTADRNRATQILSNLVGNAIKYTPEGGRVNISARRADDGRQLEFCVEDTGIGIPEKELEHVFVRFYRGANPVTRRVAGTGLGLTIARSLVHQHGGRLWVESTPDVGSRFHFTLPIAPPLEGA